jgi:hypothetical protein
VPDAPCPLPKSVFSALSRSAWKENFLHSNHQLPVLCSRLVKTLILTASALRKSITKSYRVRYVHDRYTRKRHFDWTKTQNVITNIWLGFGKANKSETKTDTVMC